MEDKHICGYCIEEEYLQKYIKQNGDIDKCSYCEKTKKVCALDEILDLIVDGIKFVYDDPVNGLGFVDGEYVKGNGQIHNSYELLVDELGLGGSKAFEDILSHLPDNLWCKKEFYDFDLAEEKIYTWEYFVTQIKYNTRYFFIKEKTGIQQSIRYKEPYYILDELANLIVNLDLIDNLKKDSIVFRVRKNGKNEKYITPEELGTPKAEECIHSNRMSPAGIPMFYGSSTKETCLAELGNKKGLYTIGKWRIKKDLCILDLTKHFQFSKRENRYFYPNFPNIFDQSRRETIYDYSFILSFASDLSKKLEKDSKENIDYVPTQIVAEYLRKVALFDQKHLDGICFYSSIDGGINYALFIEQKECLKPDRWKVFNQKIELLSFEEIEI